MTDNLPGTSPSEPFTLESLREWGIAYTSQEMGWVGRIVMECKLHDQQEPPDTIVLEPAYPLVTGYPLQQTSQGKIVGVGRMLMVAPDEFLTTPMSRGIRPVSVLRFGLLSDADFAFLCGRLYSAILDAEKMRESSRASRLGLSIAGSDSKLPPPPGIIVK